METLRRFSKKIRDILSFYFICSEKFDEDFRQLLQIFFFFGFYRPVPSNKRLFYGWTMYLMMMVNYLLSLIRDAYILFSDGNVKRALLSFSLALLLLSYSVQNLVFIVKQAKIVSMIKELTSLHEYEDENLIEPHRKVCLQLVKFYRNYLFASVTVCLGLTMFGFKLSKLFMPVLYDSFGDGFLHLPLMIISIFQGYGISAIVVVSDLLHFLCIIRAGANYGILSGKIRRCTDNEDPKENEKELIACIKYHWAITEETQNITKIFGYFFMSTAYGTVSLLACMLYIVIKANIRNDPMGYFLGVLGVSLALIRFGSICFVAEWLKGKADDLLDASYDCDWLSQSKSFRKSLLIMRYFCLRETKIKVAKFNFSRKLFYEMISNAFNFYNNIGHTFETMELRSL